MVGFLGQSEHTIDGKGRVALPASMRSELPPDANGQFNAYMSEDACIVLIPGNVWEERVRRLFDLNTFIPQNQQMKRAMSSRSRMVSLDGQGRITLPRTHIDHADLHNERVVVVGTIDTIEIWDPERFRAEEDRMNDAYSNLVDQVMSQLDGPRPA